MHIQADHEKNSNIIRQVFPACSMTEKTNVVVLGSVRLFSLQCLWSLEAMELQTAMAAYHILLITIQSWSHWPDYRHAPFQKLKPLDNHCSETHARRL